jgi:hypothetical protein
MRSSSSSSSFSSSSSSSQLARQASPTQEREREREEGRYDAELSVPDTGVALNLHARLKHHNDVVQSLIGIDSVTNLLEELVLG